MPASHRLDVPGATLSYEVRASGALLFVVGQPMTSGAFSELAQLLAEDHTVVTYDPRGLGESTVQEPAGGHHAHERRSPNCWPKLVTTVPPWTLPGGWSGCRLACVRLLVIHRGPVTEAGVQPVGGPPPGQDGSAAHVTPPPSSAKQQADDALFFLRMLKPFTRYQLAVRSAAALAERLGTTPVPFPGEHAGFLGDPTGFAEVLRRIF